jgi:hypothetical protein
MLRRDTSIKVGTRPFEGTEELITYSWNLTGTLDFEGGITKQIQSGLRTFRLSRLE